MKSKLFQTRSVSLNKNTSVIIKKINDLSAETLSEIAKWINEWEINPNHLETWISETETGKINNLIATIKISGDDFTDILSVVIWLGRMIFRYHDDISALVDDFIILDFITDSQREKVLEFFNKIMPKLEEIGKLRLIGDYERGELPYIKEIGYDVDLRLVTKKPFNPQEKNIENYEPEIERLVAVAIIGLTIDDGQDEKKIGFQLNFSELEGIIVRLQACQKQMRLLQKQYVEKTE